MKKITFLITTIALVLFNKGTAQQLDLIKDINTNANTETFTNLGSRSVNFGNKVIFTSGEDTYGFELWISDGTTAGTYLLKDITPGIEDTNFSALFKIPANNVANFFVKTETSLELWETDGTESGTIKIKDLDLDYINGNLYYLINDKYSFVGINDGNREIWTTDGTNAGTFKISSDIVIEQTSNKLSVFNNQIMTIYKNENDNLRMFLSDGTVAGTSTVDIDDNVGFNYAVLGNLIIHTRQEGASVFNKEIFSYDYATNTDTMLANINTSGGSNPYYLTTFNGHVYFNAINSDGNIYIYKTDGTSSGTTQFTNSPGAPLMYDTQFNSLETNDYLLFYSGNTPNQYHLYKLDGNIIETIFSHNFSFGFKVVNGTIYLNTNTGLYTTNGTTSGTTLLSSEINGKVMGYTSLNNIVCSNFIDNYNAIWSCNTSTGEATEILNAGSSTQDASIDKLSVIDDELLIFSYYNEASNTYELWKSDGSENGTSMLSEIEYIQESTTYNGNYVFIINKNSNYELWKSDGTVAGTQLVKTLTSGGLNHYSSNFVEINDILYFVITTSDTNDSVLWQSNLTEPGTIAVANSSIFSNTTELYVHTDNYIYFSGYNATTGAELWKTDGTLANTTMVKNIRSGTNPSSPSNFTSLGDILIFSAYGSSGREPYRSDGTDAGTYIIDDLFSYDFGDISSNPSELIAFNDNVYFNAKNNENSDRLYKTDGNSVSLVDDLIEEGHMVSDFLSIEYNGYLYFESNPSGTTYSTWLYRTNGTTTEPVGNVQYIEEFAIVADMLFMSTENELYFIDENNTITTVVLDDDFENLTPSNNRLYLTYNDIDVGKELFKIDLCNPSNIVYVDASASSGKGTGYNWEDAFLTLEDAIKDARNCNINEIHIAEGVYLTNKNSKQEKSFNIDFELVIKGGFSPVNNVTDESDRDYFLYPTILSGDLNNSSLPDAQDAHTIITINGNNVILDGLIIENGFADDASDNSQAAIGRSGAGIYVRNADNLTITNCIFRNNIAIGSGSNGVGGAFIKFGPETTTITNSLFYNNEASAEGGAISPQGGTLNIINNTLVNNNSVNGGAIHSFSSTVNITNSVLHENIASNSNNNINNAGSSTNSINYSYLQNENPIGTGNIDGTSVTSPMFTNSENDDYSILSGSPLVNAGNNTIANEPLDLAGNPRIFDGIIDIGAYELQSTLSITNTFANDFKIYPNPTSNILNIKTNSIEYSYNLYNIQGQEILKAKHQTARTIDISKLPSGIYMLKLSIDDKFESFKIIKQN